MMKANSTIGEMDMSMSPKKVKKMRVRNTKKKYLQGCKSEVIGCQVRRDRA